MTVLGKRYAHLGPFHDYVANERLAARNAILHEVLPAGELIQIPCLCGGKIWMKRIRGLNPINLRLNT